VGSAPRDMRELIQVFKKTALEWNRHNAPHLGAALAYYTILSLAPLLVVVVAIAGLAFGQQAAEGQIVWQIREFVGPTGAEAIQNMLTSARHPTEGLLAATLGIVVLLTSASAVFAELRDSLNYIWGVQAPEWHGLWAAIKYRFLSYAMVLGIGFLLMVSLVVSAALSFLEKYFGTLLSIPASALQIVNFFVSLAVITLLFALIYKIIPDAPITVRDVLPGAVLTAALFTAGKFLIGLYLGRASVGSAYGASGSLVILLVWVYYSAQIFFFGAEFTHVWATRPRVSNASSLRGKFAASRSAH
jgi:membrane protein